MIHPGELLSAYLDGELTSDEQVGIVAHLDTCDGCRAELADLQTARSQVRSLPVLEVPDWVLAEVDVYPAEVVPLRRRPAAWVAAAAAVVVLLIGISSLLVPTPTVQLEFTEIAETHRMPASQDGLPAGARAVLITPVTGMVE